MLLKPIVSLFSSFFFGCGRLSGLFFEGLLGLEAPNFLLLTLNDILCLLKLKASYSVVWLYSGYIFLRED
jgi:hypothetical protein